MTDKEELIHQVARDIHSEIPREGPGDSGSTRKAFSMLPELPASPKILDIGCGPGMQTMELTKLCDGHITALDFYQTYLDELKERAKKADVEDRVDAIQGSMFELPFENNTFDLIWAEGAIYIIGLEKGLREWRPLLKDGGYLVASHLSWVKEEVPDKAKKFWGIHFPPIDFVENNLKIAEAAGYEVIGHFEIPDSAWWDDYQTPIEKRLVMLREKYAGNEVALARIAKTQEEIDLRREHGDCYGYVFYVLRKRS